MNLVVVRPPRLGNNLFAHLNGRRAILHSTELVYDPTEPVNTLDMKLRNLRWPAPPPNGMVLVMGAESTGNQTCAKAVIKLAAARVDATLAIVWAVPLSPENYQEQLALETTLQGMHLRQFSLWNVPFESESKLVASGLLHLLSVNGNYGRYTWRVCPDKPVPYELIPLSRNTCPPCLIS